MKIIGPQFSQGVFMSKVGDYTDRFESRYDTIHLSLENQILFRNQREGTKFLKELGESLEGTIQYLPSENAIEIYLYPRKNASVDPFKRKIKQFLQEKGSSSAIEMSKYCVFCGKKGGLCFTICGHHYCPKCLTSNCEQIIKAESEIGCLKCNTPISTLDLKSNLSIEAIHNLVGLGINKFVRESSDHNFTLCPIENCNNIRSKYQGYTLCSSCGVESCALCGVIQNDLHRNKTCQQFKECSVFDLDRIIQRAKDFVNEKWDKQLGNITGIYENPGLRSGCPAIQKFSRALSKCEIENSFYAWHGTKTHDSIKNICHEGWDPKRRSGQACGRGEYFGQTSAVSAGYSRGLDNMIVALLLQVPGTSTHRNFCYVVDNPIDWQMAFNLPVLVLTYKEGKPPQFETMKIQQPLNLKQ